MQRILQTASFAFLPLLVACGGGGAGTTTAKPDENATYPLHPLAGDIKCYSGTVLRGLDTTGGVQLFVRRAVNPDTGVFVEDSVVLSPTVRYVTSLGAPATPGEAEYAAPVTELNNHYSGYGYRGGTDMSQFGYVIELDNKGARYLTVEEASDQGLKVTMVGDSPAVSEKAGLTMPKSKDEFVAMLTAVSKKLAEDTAANKLTFSELLRGTLTEMPLADCNDKFTKFKPPGRAW